MNLNTLDQIYNMVPTKLSTLETMSYHHSSMCRWHLYNSVYHFIYFVLVACQSCYQLVTTLAKVQR